MDDASFRLALQLQLEDLELLKDNQKGKQRKGEISDVEAAMELYKQGLEASVVLDQDRTMCRSIARAVRSDGAAIQSFAAEEEQATRDRSLARSMRANPRQNTVGPKPPAKPPKPLDAELLRKLEAFNLGRDDSGDAAESSSWAATRNPAHGVDGEKMETRECTSCAEQHVAANLATCPCSHNYCRECLNTLFDRATTDESLFSPRCCKVPIPLEDNLAFLPSALVGRFRAKELEFLTPNRAYCHRPECSAFVPPQFILADVATCIKCSAKTCVLCKGAQHDKECPNDGATQELLRMAKENGWQRCYSCSRLVELNYGCNHMTCICKAQFCYGCGKKWKTCSCEQWNERNLYERAAAVVDREANYRRLLGQRRAEIIQRAANHLVRNHECDHSSWSSRSGRHECDECHDTLPSYIYECRQCLILACRRCRYNRL